jgi:cation diffusion facilitator family transporter
MTSVHRDEFRLQSRTLLAVVAVGILVMGLKFVAYFITRSDAIFSDALESIINVAAGGFAIFSLYYAAQPKDENHPYGHGKIEFFSAGFEGAMILVAGISIIIKAAFSLLSHKQVEHLGTGVLITAASGVINFVMGTVLVKYGEKYRSLTLVADGKHLLSDTYSSAGLIAGLLLMYFTGITWLDGILAIVFGSIIIFTGYRLVRKSLAGLMDEVDEEVLLEIESIINDFRQKEWIDIHNFRVLKYGNSYHIDCHITLPWYWNLDKAHEGVQSFENIFRQKFPDKVELFIHADPCLPASCHICQLDNCPERKHPFTQTIEWKIKRLVINEKHRL